MLGTQNVFLSWPSLCFQTPVKQNTGKKPKRNRNHALSVTLKEVFLVKPLTQEGLSLPSYALAVATASERQHALMHGYEIASSCGGEGGGHKHLQPWGKREWRAPGSELRSEGTLRGRFFHPLLSCAGLDLKCSSVGNEGLFAEDPRRRSQSLYSSLLAVNPSKINHHLV